MIPGLILVLAAFQLPSDTVALDVATAFRRGLDRSPVLSASRYRAVAAAGRARQETAWPNPQLNVSAENVGQQYAFTGRDGLPGLEGQAVLTTALPFGWERSGSIRSARAEATAALAGVEATELTVGVGLLNALGSYLRDQSLMESARDELGTLSSIAEALALQAQEGRASSGDAARAHLAQGMAATRLARREATLAMASAELVRLLGYGSETAVRLQASACVAPTEQVQGEPQSPPPDVRIAQAQVEAARGSIDLARGRRVPDLTPQLGLRRTDERTGLYLGFSTDLPLFDRGSQRLAAARAEEDAARAHENDVEQRWEAALTGTRRALSALERAGSQFGTTWFESLEQTVTAAEARFRVGEGTLFELLDSRRARLQALDDYVAWQAEWWAARANLARLGGRPMDASIICMDPYR